MLKHWSFSCRIFTALFLVFLSSIIAAAQTYPVQVSTFITPPYSPYLSDYTALGSEKIAINLLFNDPVRFELPVRLKFTIEGSGITITTKSDLNLEPLYLQSGIPERLTGSDLAPYLDPRNLNFQGISTREIDRRGAIPDGIYRICVEVFEVNRNLRVSNTGCTMAWMILNDPPIINLPVDGIKVRIQDPQMVIFQWTPRHTGSPNSAFTTDYDVELVEVRPKGRNPNDAILTSPPIFTATVQSTMLIYGPAETPLIPGQQYAFRVRAKSISKGEELDLFKNHGYSQVVMFQYGDQCLSPQNIELNSTNPGKFDASWDPLGEHTSFTVRYKEKNNSNAQWFEETTLLRSHSISGLRPNTEYLAQVVGYCGVVGHEDIQTLTVKTPNVSATDFVCGDPATPINIDRSTLKTSLKPFDIIESGDFKIALTEVTGGNGTFSGKGVASIPWFKFATFHVEFEDIKVNQKNQVFEGKIKSTLKAGSEVIYDEGYIPTPPNNQGGSSTEVLLDEPAQPTVFQGHEATVQTDIKAIVVDAQGAIVVTNEDGTTTSVERPKDPTYNTKYQDVKITDINGDAWIVDKDGKVTESPRASDAAANGGYVTENAFGIWKFGANQDGSFTFLTPTGGYVVLPSHVENVTTFFGYYGNSLLNHADLYKEFLSIVPGTLKRFKIDQRVFTAKIEKQGQAFALIGYFDQHGKPYNPADFPVAITGMSYEQKSIIHAFGDFGGTQALFILRVNTSGAKEFKASDLVQDCFSLQVGTLVDSKSIPYKNLIPDSPITMTPDILNWAFTNYAGDDTYLIRNKLAELKALYPRFMDQLTMNFSNWSRDNVCNPGGGRFEEWLRDEYCESYLIQSGYPLTNSTGYRLKSNAQLPGNSKEWLTLFYNRLQDAVNEHQKDILKNINDFNRDASAIRTIDTDKLRNLVNTASQEDINQLNSLSVLSILSKILNERTIEDNDNPGNDGEGAIIKLIGNIHPTTYNDVLQGIERENVFDKSKFLFKQMFEGVDGSFFFQDNNREKMVSILTKMVLSDKDFYMDRLNESYNKLGSSAFVLKYNNFLVQLGKSIIYNNLFYKAIDAANNGTLTTSLETSDLTYDWKPEGKIEVRQYKEVGFYETYSVKPVTLRPFDLVYFINLSNLPTVTKLTSELKLTDIPLPVITLLYATKKAGEQTVGDIVATAFDVGSIAVTGGAYAAVKNGADVINKARKAFMIADMASSGLSIAATATQDYENNSNISSVLRSLSAVTAVASLGNLGFDNIQRIRQASNFSQLIDNAKDASQHIEKLPTKEQVEAIMTAFSKMTPEEVSSFVIKYQTDADNSIAIAIKYLKEAAVSNDLDKVKEAAEVLRKIGLARSGSANLAKFIDKIPETALKAWIGSFVTKNEMVLSTVNASTVKMTVQVEGISHKVDVGMIRSNGEISTVELTNNIDNGIAVNSSEIKSVSQDGHYALRCRSNTCEIEQGACFTGGTLVHTTEGAKHIEDITEGQYVKTYNPVCEKSTFSKVVRTTKRTWYKLFRVLVGNDTILATPSHPFYIPSIKKYVSADSLKRGMRLLTLAGASLAIQDVKAIDTFATVYNFEVADNHNYYVGNEGVLVHNANPDCFFAQLGMRVEDNERLTQKILDLGFTDDLKKTFKSDLSNQDFFAAIVKNINLVDAWNTVSKHAALRINLKFLENISGFSSAISKQLDEDLLNPRWADELKTLFKESPDDVVRIWKTLKDDAAEGFEISKTDPGWEKWRQREFFKQVTAKGKSFEMNVCLTTFKNRSSVKYLELKNKVSTDFGKNLDDYDMYYQVQLKYDGDNYFVADQVFVKYKTISGVKIADDIIVIENKLSINTPLTSSQTDAFQKATFTVRSIAEESQFERNTFLIQNTILNFSDSKQWYKVHDGENGDVISGIEKME